MNTWTVLRSYIRLPSQAERNRVIINLVREGMLREDETECLGYAACLRKAIAIVIVVCAFSLILAGTAVSIGVMSVGGVIVKQMVSAIKVRQIG